MLNLVVHAAHTTHTAVRRASRPCDSGSSGNGAAPIFCQKIEAELLAIDGYYQTAEEIDVALRNRPAQAWLEGSIMKITPLS